MRAAVQDDATVRTDQVGKAGRLTARIRRRHGHVLVAEAAMERCPEMLLSTLGLQGPGPKVERRLMAHVLLVSANKLGNPLALRVLMEADDRTLHPGSVRGGAPEPLEGRGARRSPAATRSRPRGTLRFA